MENKQTAVEWLESQFDWISNYMMEEHKEQLFNQAKAMEKQQIMSAYSVCDDSGTIEETEYHAENYYKRTYGN